MYQVVRDGLAFYVTDEDSAKRYAADGYTIYSVNKVVIDKDGDFKTIKDGDFNFAVTGSSDTIKSPVAVDIIREEE